MESVSLLDCAARRRSLATLSRFHRGRVAEQGSAVSAGPAAGRGDHRCHASGRRSRRRPPPASADRAALARRTTNQRSARPPGERSRQRPRRRARPAWKGRQATRGWNGPLGMGAARSLARVALPVGALFCVLRGPTRGLPCAPAVIRGQLRRVAQAAGVRRRFAPHQLRHAHAVEMSREGIPLLVIQRQLGHADLGITSAYLRGIDNTEIIHAVHERPGPMIPAGVTLAPHR